jgi:radical SAM protein (TIGR01212 family)
MERILYTLKQFLDDRFEVPVRKLPIHTYLGCPHRDAETGLGGCIYCNESGFSNPEKQERNIRVQIQQGLSDARDSGKEGKYIAYFQTGTNTCAEPELLESWWRTVLEFPEDIIGLSVSTRPDCLADQDIRILSKLGQELMVWVELGLQSANDETLKRINRGHDVRSFLDAVDRLKAHPHLLTCAHIILGLPGETEADMEHTIQTLNHVGIHGIKIHHLEVVKDTVLADWFKEGRVSVLDEESYIRLMIRLIPRIRPDMVLHRLFGDIHSSMLIAPKWTSPKTRMIQKITEALESRNLYQGKHYPPAP